jgi:hypothetical protein
MKIIINVVLFAHHIIENLGHTKSTSRVKIFSKQFPFFIITLLSIIENTFDHREQPKKEEKFIQVIHKQSVEGIECSPEKMKIGFWFLVYIHTYIHTNIER